MSHRRRTDRTEPVSKKAAGERIKARARDLHDRGMPYQMAMAVAKGRLPLNDALERMARVAEVDKLMERHGLTKALAMQIAMGHANLEQVLFRRHLEAYRARHRERSPFDEAKEDAELRTLGVHGQQQHTGSVVGVSRYEIALRLKGDEVVESLHKLQIKYMHRHADWKTVRRMTRYDKELNASPRPPVQRPQERYPCSDRRLFYLMEKERDVVATLLEGEQLRGTVAWFSRYELCLAHRGTPAIVVCRHALHDLVGD